MANGGARREDVVFIETIGSGSLDYYSQKLAAELRVRVRSTDAYSRTAERFNVRLFSAASLIGFRHDVELVRSLRRERALVHLPNHHMGRYGAFLSRPYVVTVHDLIRTLDLAGEDVLIHPPNHRDRLLLRLDQAGIRRASHLVAVSETTKRDIVELLAIPSERVTVVHEGIDHGCFRPQPGRLVPYKYVLYVGSEQPRKDVRTLLRAFARLRADLRFHDLRLVKIGMAGGREAPFREATLAAVRECGLEDAVVFTGRVPEEELPAWYTGAELLVFPSRYEGFGFPPLEAMACACPVVVSDAASLLEVTGGAALVAPVGDARAFAERASEILTDPDLRARLVERGLARAAEFSWTRAARETAAVWEAVLDGRPNPDEGTAADVVPEFP
jgi:glycosyltransferase involved in cell wall biosynthesis